MKIHIWINKTLQILLNPPPLGFYVSIKFYFLIRFWSDPPTRHSDIVSNSAIFFSGGFPEQLTRTSQCLFVILWYFHFCHFIPRRLKIVRSDLEEIICLLLFHRKYFLFILDLSHYILTFRLRMKKIVWFDLSIILYSFYKIKYNLAYVYLQNYRIFGCFSFCLA